MEKILTPLKDLLILKPRIFADERGYFYESFNRITFHDLDIDIYFCQDNNSKSSYGAIRGLHYQKAPYSQTKLISVVQGAVWDVAVDLRESSPSFGQWYGVELSEENHLQLLVPKGFAHGFSTLSETATLTYKCDDYYKPEMERGIIYNDPKLNIDWKIPAEKLIVSKKDKLHPIFADADINFY